MDAQWRALAVPGKPETTKEFGENVERNLDIRDRIDDSDGYTEDSSEEDVIEDGGGGSLCRVGAYANSTECGSNDEDHKVRPLRYFIVLLREASCKVRIRRKCERSAVVADIPCVS